MALQLSHVHSNVETPGIVNTDHEGEITLQLSHVHSNVETASRMSRPELSARASIEPRSFERGNILDGLTDAVLPLVASIEPRSFERGNLNGARREPIAPSKLQLSHVHSNVETTLRPQLHPPAMGFN